LKSGASLGINAEIIGFINSIVSGVTKLGTQTISLTVGPRIPMAGPSATKQILAS